MGILKYTSFLEKAILFTFLAATYLKILVTFNSNIWSHWKQHQE